MTRCGEVSVLCLVSLVSVNAPIVSLIYSRLPSYVIKSLGDRIFNCDGLALVQYRSEPNVLLRYMAFGCGLNSC